MAANTLGGVVEVRGRFHRSVRLNQDWEARSDLGGYLLTPTARGLATRMISGLSEQGGTRAWSVTGPYGSGKSAFALFLTDLLSRSTPFHPEAQGLREELGFSPAPFLPVLVVGQRSPVKPALLAALADGLEPVDSTLAQETREAAGAESLSDERVVALFDRAGHAAERAEMGGLLIVLDEFGKFLEYAALHPEQEDLFVMQGLAEFSARSSTPTLLVTLLHTAFAEYLGASAADSRRAEWQKVQGRFADAAFQEPPEQLLRLIGAAIDRRHMPEELEVAYLDAVGRAVRSPALDETRRRLPLSELLPACAPLDPVTALLLSPLFRSKLAQNERSLFAFLAGHEPLSFVEFVSSPDRKGEGPTPFYRIDRLYDYVSTALGAGAYRGSLGRRWAEVEHALSRVKADAPQVVRSVVKAVGLLGMYGRPVGLRASEETISLALGDPKGTAEALDSLATSSIVVYRRHEGAYGLWEGSDVDLDAQLEEGLEQSGQGSLAERLKRAIALRPLVARAHYIETGALRYFDVDVVDGTPSNLEQKAEETTQADGRLVYVLVPEQEDRAALVESARMLTRDAADGVHLRVFAFPRPMAGLEEALREVEAWRWVQVNVRALEGDPVARRELRARRLYAQERLEEVAGRVFWLRGRRFDPSASEWVQGGAPQTLGSARRFSSWLSELCREVYHRAPILQNELLNRSQLSSAAAAARRILIERMLSHEGKDRLGIGGTPPEVSMYESLLVRGDFYRFRGGEIRFGEPVGEWEAVWEATEAFLGSTHEGRRPLRELYELWKRPPYGLREGPLPVLLCAVILAHRDEVALYEDGVFVPSLGIEVFERLMRTPDLFEIQRFALSAHGRQALEAAGAVAGSLGEAQDHDTESSLLLRVVRPLVVSAARLPPFARYTKRTEPPQAAKLREVLLRASDPYALMFEEMPEALEVSLDSPDETSRFGELLRECLLGLQRAYPRLLDKVEEQLRGAFDLNGSSEEAKERLRARAEPLVGSAADRTLALFVREASRKDQRDWREALARVVKDGTPPSNWRDADLVTFQLRLREVASDFVRLEELVSEKQRTGAEQILRIGILNGQVQEARGLVALTAERAPVVASLVERIAALLEGETELGEEGRRIRLAALTQAAMRDLKHEGKAEDE